MKGQNTVMSEAFGQALDMAEATKLLRHGVEDVESAVCRTDEDDTVFSFGKRGDGAVREAAPRFLGEEPLEGESVIAVETALCPNPDEPLAVLKHGRDLVVRKAVPNREMAEADVLVLGRGGKTKRGQEEAQQEGTTILRPFFGRPWIIAQPAKERTEPSQGSLAGLPRRAPSQGRTRAGKLPAVRSVSLSVSPHRHLVLTVTGETAEFPVPSDIASRIEAAFHSGTASGVLHLGASEFSHPLPPPLTFFQKVGRLFMTRLTRLPDLAQREKALLVEPPSEDLKRLLDTAPFMKGQEYLDISVLEDVWAGLNQVAIAEISSFQGGFQAWLRSKGAVWNTLGRVVFHLAENKKSQERPFAFLATYTSRISESAQVQHLPLGRALKEYGAARDRDALLSLLAPVQRAAEKSPFVRSLVDSGQIYSPLMWSPAEAWDFLNVIPLLEESGLVVRVPGLWNGTRPPRPAVKITVGNSVKNRLGMDAILDFSVDITLDGEKLTEAERQQILSATSGLALVRGKWIEVDSEKLGALLGLWQKAAGRSAAGELSFSEALRVLSGMELAPGSDPSLDPAARQWISIEPGIWLTQTLDRLRRPEALAALEPGAALKATLRPYQKAGVQWLHALAQLRLGGCLADDMGLGKTIQIISLLLLLKPTRRGPALLVVPASLLSNWRSELERFAPSLSVFTAHPSGATATEIEAARQNISSFDVVLTSYGTLLRMEWLHGVSWALTVLDEAQAIKNPGAKQTRAAKSLKSTVRFALTGTPVENRLSDLFSIFDFLAPGLLGSAQSFAKYTKKLAEASEPDYGPLRNLLKPYILRRLKTDKSVISDLPDKTEMKTYCSLSKKQAVLYQEAVKELTASLVDAEGMKRRAKILAFLMRFKQICNHPSQWLQDGRYEPEASGKFERMGEICEEIASRQEKALVFTQFQEMTAPISGFLSGVFGRQGLVLHGATDVKKRKDLVAEFQREDGPPFFVLSLKAGGTGLNLTEASHVIHFDRWWNPAVEEQATDRAFRIGQRRNVLVHKFLCKGTIEEKIDALIESKRTLSKEILAGGAEVLLTEMTDDDLLDIVRLDLAAALGN